MERHLEIATRQLGRGLDALEGELRGAGLPEETVLDLRLVAEEVLTNIAKYGHDVDGNRTVRLRLTLAAGEATLEFTDDGRPFDPLAAGPEEQRPETERPLGGLGLLLIRSLVDSADYARRGSLNVLTLKRRAGDRGADVP